MKHKNNHARSKQKRKALRLKNRQRSQWVNEMEKAQDNGHLIPQSAAHAIQLKRNIQLFEMMRRAGRSMRSPFNQRQRRKRLRQNPHKRRYA